MILYSSLSMMVQKGGGGPGASPPLLYAASRALAQSGGTDSFITLSSSLLNVSRRAMDAGMPAFGSRRFGPAGCAGCALCQACWCRVRPAATKNSSRPASRACASQLRATRRLAATMGAHLHSSRGEAATHKWGDIVRMEECCGECTPGPAAASSSCAAAAAHSGKAPHLALAACQLETSTSPRERLTLQGSPELACLEGSRWAARRNCTPLLLRAPCMQSAGRFLSIAVDAYRRGGALIWPAPPNRNTEEAFGLFPKETQRGVRRCDHQQPGTRTSTTHSVQRHSKLDCGRQARAHSCPMVNAWWPPSLHDVPAVHAARPRHLKRITEENPQAKRAFASNSKSKT